MRKWFEGALLLFITTCLSVLPAFGQTMSDEHADTKKEVQAGHAVGQGDILPRMPIEVPTAGEAGPKTEVEAGHAVGMNWHPHDRIREEPAAKTAEETKPAPTGQAQVGRETECGKIVIAVSPHAVGDPCLTTEEFMAQLGLDEKRRQGVFDLVQYVGKPSRAGRVAE